MEKVSNSVSTKQQDEARGELLYYLSVPANEVKKQVLERVVGQDDAVDSLVDTIFLMIQGRLSYFSGEDPDLLPKLSSMCIVGPTASGKTHGVRSFCNVVGVKMFLIDCSTLTGTGWRGLNLNKALEPVYKFQQENPTSLCLILFDEADKMRISKDEAASSFCPQANFLSLLEERDFYDLNFEDDKNAEEKLLNLGMVLPVFAGAFTGIEEDIANRLSESNTSFIPKSGSYYTNSEGARLRSMVSTADLVSYGMLNELCGRIGRVINMEALDRESLKKIICEGDRCLQKKFDRLMPFKCRFEIDESAVEYLLNETEETQLGARGLENMLVPSAASARTLAWENPKTKKIILSYSNEDKDFVLTQEVPEEQPREPKEELAAC